ncbi:hypothetical protein MRQ86_00115 [Streptomyces sp. MMS21 TC-5]|uniref:hypothetical protein n=1 Tax=Streptomyces sp. MMS21 TC-5 TaxID=2925833 RepID=UPI001F609D00|nr:hypothetical protein [Streptomyces sp. MMS21 TC-5]MCI4078786.1 hypothetical protein [Streptomyces sp. MMS21 TC-5]
MSLGEFQRVWADRLSSTSPAMGVVAMSTIGRTTVVYGRGTGKSSFIAANTLYWDKNAGRAVRAASTSAGKAWVQHSALMALRDELHDARLPALEDVDRRVRDLRAQGWTIARRPEAPVAAPGNRARLVIVVNSYSSAVAVAQDLLRRWGGRDVRPGPNLAQLLDEIEAYGVDLWRIVEAGLRLRTDWRTPCFRRLPSSPCGILKLATPRVPRGPDSLLRSEVLTHSWALSA